MQQYSKDYNRYNWLMNFILCNNKEGLDQTGSFATATKCLKVRDHGYIMYNDCAPGGGLVQRVKRQGGTGPDWQLCTSNKSASRWGTLDIFLGGGGACINV